MSCYPILHLERPLLAVILCGGKSERMGTDKGLMLHNSGMTWAEQLKHTCTSMGLETIISIHEDQEPTYKKVFQSEEIVVDLFPRLGPCGGLISVHGSYEEYDLLVLSCDMQLLDEQILYSYISHIDKLGEYDVVVAKYNDFYQPFPGLYGSEFLHKIAILHHTKQMNYSLQSIFKQFYVFELSLPEDSLSKLKSFNSPQDLMELL